MRSTVNLTCQVAREFLNSRPGPSPSDARAFLEERFVAVEARKEDGTAGMLTAYFAPEYQARSTPDAEFDAPVLSRPDNLADVGDRAAIEAGSARSTALAREAVGAAAIPLPARRSIAVDPSHWTYGEAVWIEADGGNLVGALASYRGLVMALDTGSAIRGPVRADLYIGTGDAAGREAGAVRHPLRMWRLIPRY